MADWVGIPASALGFFKSSNTSLLEILETDNRFLAAMQNEFVTVRRQKIERRGRGGSMSCASSKSYPRTGQG